MHFTTYSMNLLPYEDFYIITRSKPAEVQALLQQEVTPGPDMRAGFLGTEQPGIFFSGYVLANAFSFRRIQARRNAFLPQIKGETKTWLNGSRVRVIIKPELAVTIFLSFFILATAFAMAEMINDAIVTRKWDDDILIPFAMILASWLLPMFSFNMESKKATKMLLQILDGEIVRK